MAFIRQRQIEMAVLSVLTYSNSKLQTSYENIINEKEKEKESSLTSDQNSSNDTTSDSSLSSASARPQRSKATITAQSFADIFLADDKFMTRNHMTEYWY